MGLRITPPLAFCMEGTEAEEGLWQIQGSDKQHFGATPSSTISHHTSLLTLLFILLDRKSVV